MGLETWMVREVADQSYQLRSQATWREQPDRVEELSDEIVTLAAHVAAATHRLLTLIFEFDQLRGWERSGHKDCAHWLSVRTGIDRGAAQEKVRAARALAHLPLTSQAMARGELSFSKVRALTRKATPESEEALLEMARGSTTEQLERMLRAWEKGSRQDEAAQERARHESRTLSIFPDDDGRYLLKARLTPEVGALLMRVIEAASDALYRERAVPGVLVDPDKARKEAAQLRADALGLIAERAMAAGFGGRAALSESGADLEADPDLEANAAGEPGADSDKDSEPHAASARDASDGSPPPEAPISGSRADRYQVVLHVDLETLSAEGGIGRSELEDGTRLSAETARRLSCDAGLVRVAQKADGTVLDVGRKTRTTPGALRRALEIRDRGCRFPGCGLRFTDAHHVKHWADGGETSLDNCLLLCRHHHRLVHEGRWTIGFDDQRRPIFFDPRGHMHYEGRWQPPVLPDDAVAALMAENVARGMKSDVASSCG
jgi:hypothetical protein